MAKECKTDGCSWPVFSNGLCQQHWRPLYAKPIYKNPSLKQCDKQPARPFKAIKKVSDKQLQRLELYRKERDAHFKEQPFCQYPGCTATDVTLHHGAGKTGDLLFNRKYFKSLCMPHHRWAEESPIEAQKLGLSFKRLDK